ncbi:MAG TPA: glycosyltransferase family 9 protein [Planctomycetota bacterium]|nr:glycosyltransferase family 9 protein [Planctomycetota bacterium]
MSSLGHVLIIRPGALGDAILTLPVLHALKLAGADSVTVLGTPASWKFLRAAHEGVRVRDFASSEWLGLFSESAALGPAAEAMLSRTQTAIVYLNDVAEIERRLARSGVRTRLYGEAPRESSADFAGAEHAAMRLLKPLKELGIDTSARALETLDLSSDPLLQVDEFERARALERLGLDADGAESFVALHPGSGGRRKCWAVERFARLVPLISRRRLAPLVFFGPADDDVRAEFESHVEAGTYWDAVVNWPLRDVLALLTFCGGFIGNDSGLTHLAARACPVTALFGPTSPAVWAPLGKEVCVLQAPNRDLASLSVEEVGRFLP